MQVNSPSPTEPLKQPVNTEFENESLNEKTKSQPKQRTWFKFLAFPLATWFIIGNEFCERFAFYGNH